MEAKERLGEPFYHAGNSIGCLLVHGFTGSPAHMKFLGERLAACGWTVMGIRLSGHGLTPEELALTSWEDWVDDVRLAAEQLRNTCEVVIGIGFSLGGLIVLHHASRRVFDGIVTLNAPMLLQDWGARLAHLYKPFVKFVAKPNTHIQEQIRTTGEQEISVYAKVPVECIDSINKAIRKVRRELGRINCPSLIMQSENDKTVNPRSAKIIHNNLIHSKSQLIWFKKSGHILPLGPEREEVGVMAAAYIRQFEHPRLKPIRFS